jgi:hypothetical protein
MCTYAYIHIYLRYWQLTVVNLYPPHFIAVQAAPLPGPPKPAHPENPRCAKAPRLTFTLGAQEFTLPHIFPDVNIRALANASDGGSVIIGESKPGQLEVLSILGHGSYKQSFGATLTIGSCSQEVAIKVIVMLSEKT